MIQPRNDASALSRLKSFLPISSKSAFLGAMLGSITALELSPALAFVLAFDFVLAPVPAFVFVFAATDNVLDAMVLGNTGIASEGEDAGFEVEGGDAPGKPAPGAAESSFTALELEAAVTVLDAAEVEVAEESGATATIALEC